MSRTFCARRNPWRYPRPKYSNKRATRLGADYPVVVKDPQQGRLMNEILWVFFSQSLVMESQKRDTAQWSRMAWSWIVSTGQLTHSLASLIVPLIQLLALQCSITIAPFSQIILPALSALFFSSLVCYHTLRLLDMWVAVRGPIFRLFDIILHSVLLQPFAFAAEIQQNSIEYRIIRYISKGNRCAGDFWHAASN